MAASLNNRAAAFGDSRDQFVNVPVFSDQIQRRLAGNGGIGQVREHRAAVVAPNGELGNLSDGGIGLLSNLSQSAVFIQTHHGGEVARVEVRSAATSDVGVGIAGVTDNQNFDVAVGDFVHCLTLFNEDLRIGGQKIGSLHIGRTGTGTD